MVAGPEDTPETLSFYSEPVMASLSNIITPPDDKEKDKGTSLSKDYNFLEVELKYGILQVSDPYEESLESLRILLCLCGSLESWRL